MHDFLSRSRRLCNIKDVQCHKQSRTMPVDFDHAALVLSVQNVSSAFLHYQGLSVINGTAYEKPCLRVWNMASSSGILCLDQNWQFCSTTTAQGWIGGTANQALRAYPSSPVHR
jgi:hypothetical protein